MEPIRRATVSVQSVVFKKELIGVEFRRVRVASDSSDFSKRQIVAASRPQAALLSESALRSINCLI